MSEYNRDIISEYKDQIRILREQNAELQDDGKAKDGANKRCLQKLEHLNEDLTKANEDISKLKKQIKELKETEKLLYKLP